MNHDSKDGKSITNKPLDETGDHYPWEYASGEKKSRAFLLTEKMLYVSFGLSQGPPITC